jgi:hypothetical protein
MRLPCPDTKTSIWQITFLVTEVVQQAIQKSQQSRKSMRCGRLSKMKRQLALLKINVMAVGLGASRDMPAFPQAAMTARLGNRLTGTNGDLYARLISIGCGTGSPDRDWPTRSIVRGH